jgi:pimeloyl-ACP methyl ester carboxylesterase
MTRLRLVTKTLIPWFFFFALYNHGRLELEVAIVVALVLNIALNFKVLRQGSLFEWCSTLFFVLLFCLIIVLQHHWSILHIHLITMTFFSLIVWYSIIIKRPLTLPYVSPSFAAEAVKSDLFYELNYHLTIVWGLIFMVNALLAIIPVFYSSERHLCIIIIPLILMFFGFWFTFWFPDWYKKRVLGEGGVINIRGLSNLRIAKLPIANIAYRCLGKGPIALLLPGAYMTMYNWDPDLLQKLSKQFTVVICDYPDIGRSTLNQGDFSIVNLVNAFSEFISFLTKQPITLIGYSLGGRIAQKLAIHYRDKVNYLVLIATDVGSSRSKKPDAHIIEVFEKIVQDPTKREELMLQVMFPPKVLVLLLNKLHAIYQAGALVEEISNSMCQLEKQVAENWYQGTGTYSQLNEIDAKTLVISGEQDQIVDRQNSLLLVNGIPGAKGLEFSDAGHGVIHQHPDSIAEAIFELTQS